MSAEPQLGARCPHCGEPWLRPTNLPGRYRCVYCLHRFELVSGLPELRRAFDDRPHGAHLDRDLRQLRGQHAARDMRPPQLAVTRVAPSILAADFAQLGAQVREVLDGGAKVIHVDVMDGHFVPSITMGPLAVSALREIVAEYGAMLDVHLMIERPERQVAEFTGAGAGSITIHAEATPHLDYVLDAIRAAGAGASCRVPLDGAHGLRRGRAR